VQKERSGIDAHFGASTQLCGEVVVAVKDVVVVGLHSLPKIGETFASEPSGHASKQEPANKNAWFMHNMQCVDRLVPANIGEANCSALSTAQRKQSLTPTRQSSFAEGLGKLVVPTMAAVEDDDAVAPVVVIAVPVVRLIASVVAKTFKSGCVVDASPAITASLVDVKLEASPLAKRLDPAVEVTPGVHHPQNDGHSSDNLAPKAGCEHSATSVKAEQVLESMHLTGSARRVIVVRVVVVCVATSPRVKSNCG
jgi:hypothetical protein